MLLKEQLRAIYKEYARQTGEILGIKPSYWVGNDSMSISTCAFGDLFLDMNAMQELVDNMDQWVAIHGDTEGVANAVFAWAENRDEYPYFNMPLWMWLNGDRPDECVFKITTLSHQIGVLKQVEFEYPTHSLSNVIMQLEARIKEIRNQRKGE